MTMGSFAVQIIWSVSEQLIMVPSAYLAIEPFYRHGNISRRVFLLLMAFSALLGVSCGILYVLYPQLQMLLFALSGVAVAVVLPLLLRVRSVQGLLQFLFLFSFSEFLNYTIVNLAFVADAYMGDPALAIHSLTWVGMGVQWVLVALEILAYRRVLRTRVSYLLACGQDGYIDLFWKRIWFIPLVTYLVEIVAIPYDTAILRDDGNGVKATLLMLIMIMFVFVAFELEYRLMREKEEAISHLRENDLLQLRLRQMSSLESRIAEARKARHDLRHFQNTVAMMAERGDVEEMRAYARAFGEALDRDPLVWCENPLANAIIDFYLVHARDIGAEVEVDADVPDECGITDLQLSSLLGNVLENAVEAIGRMGSVAGAVDGRADAAPSGTPSAPQLSIRLSAGPDRKFVLDVRNSYNGKLKRDGTGVFLSAKHPGSGVGTANVRELAESAGGFARFGDEDGLFRTFIVIPVQHAQGKMP